MKGLKDWRAERLKMKTNVQLNEGRRRPVCFGSRPGFGEWPGGLGAGFEFRVSSGASAAGCGGCGAMFLRGGRTEAPSIPRSPSAVLRVCDKLQGMKNGRTKFEIREDDGGGWRQGCVIVIKDSCR